MKAVFKKIFFSLVALTALHTQSAKAAEYSLYCSTVVFYWPVTASWNSADRVQEAMESLQYKFKRQSNLTGADHKVVWLNADASSDAEALKIVTNSKCVTEASQVRSALNNLKIPMKAQIQQCAGAYLGTFKGQNCFSTYVTIK